MKVMSPAWTGRDVALWCEQVIPTEGGQYGWDHHSEAQPIPGARRQEWRRRQTIAERAAAPAQLRLVA